MKPYRISYSNEWTKVIFLIVLLLWAPLLRAEENLIYSISLGYDGTYMSLMNSGVQLMEGEAPDQKTSPEDGFLVKVFDEEHKVLHTFRFTVDRQPVFQPLRKDTPIPPSPKMEPEYTRFVLTVPYFSQATSFEIYNNEEKLLIKVDVSRFARKKPKTDETLKDEPPADGGASGNLPQASSGSQGEDSLSLGPIAVGAWLFRKFWRIFLISGILALGYWIYRRKRG